MLSLALAFLSVASSVLAHGNVQEITVGSPAATFTSYLPYQDPYKSPVPDRITRKIPGNGPVEDVTLIDIQCNQGAEPAALVAPVVAGSQVAFNWTDWPTSHIGPVITYMARAPSDITKWSPGSDAVWFKIDEAGLDNGKWAATDVLLGNNGIWTVTIPSSLKAGQYLIRHEIIALHAAGSYPGAQFYPMCAQFEVTGSGTSLPNDSDLVSFPGAYTPSSPGVVYNPYAGLTTYPIPGPAVWDGTGSGTGSGGSGSASSTAAAASSTTAAAATSTAAVASSSAAPATTAAASSTEAAASATEVASSTEAAVSSAVEEVSSTEAAATSPAAQPTTKASSAAAAPTTAPVSSVKPSATTAAPSGTSAAAGALATHYAQCGGRNFNGATGCVSPYVCKQWNEWYYQCVEA